MVEGLQDCAGVAGVVVATPTTTHFDVVADALRLGVPVAVEKPFTCDVRQAEALVAAGAGRLFVLHKWAYHPGVQALATLARDGALGEVRGLRTTRTQWAHDHADVDAVWTLAPHDLSIVLAVLGYLPTPRSAWAVPTADGGLASLVGVLGVQPWAMVDVGAGVPGPPRREVVLHCSDGLARLASAGAPNVEVHHGDGSRADLALPQTEPLLRELELFRDHLLGGPPLPTGAAEGLAVVRALSELRLLAGQ